jgi:hypothetical protein
MRRNCITVIAAGVHSYWPVAETGPAAYCQLDQSAAQLRPHIGHLRVVVGPHKGTPASRVAGGGLSSHRTGTFNGCMQFCTM